MKKSKLILNVGLSFVLSFVLAFSSLSTVFASNETYNGGGHSRYSFTPVFPDEWVTFDYPQKYTWVTSQDFYKNAVDDFERIYILSSYSLRLLTFNDRFNAVMQYLSLKGLGVSIDDRNLKEVWNGVIKDCESQNVSVCDFNSSGEFYLSDAYISLFKEALDAYVDANSPKFWILDTQDYTRVPASGYSSADHYRKAKDFFKAHSNDIVSGFTTNVNSYFYVLYTDEKIAFWIPEYIPGCKKAIFVPYNEDWTAIKLNIQIYKFDSSQNDFVAVGNAGTNSNDGDSKMFIANFVHGGSTSKFLDNYTSVESFSYCNGKTLQVFDTREHAVDYITKTSAVYRTTPTYTGGNLVIPEGALKFDYSSIYNAIYDAITKANQNGDSLTAEQIQQMIDDAIADALKDLNNGSGSDPGTSDPGTSGGGSSGNNSGTVSGGDLSGGSGSGLLSALFNAVKTLFGFIGEIVNMVVDTFKDLSLKIPQGFTAFLVDLFPMIPEEWISSVRLAVTFALLIMLINIFKK